MNFFKWYRGGNPAVEPPNEPTGSNDAKNQPTGQSPGNRAADLRATVSDEQKWKESLARWRPDIKPTDTDYTNKKAEFEREPSAAGLSTDEILRKHFSIFEVRKISEYVDKKRDPDFYHLQKEAADRYKEILQTEAWRNEGEHASLTTKLTMAYFGLPVEPLMMKDLFSGIKSSFFTDFDDDQDMALDRDGMFVPEDKRPLRFLNYYDKRGWGKDNSHSKQSYLVSFLFDYYFPVLSYLTHAHRSDAKPSL